MTTASVATSRRPGVGRRILVSPALTTLWRRLLQGVLVVLGVTFLTFGAVNLLPGSAAQAILGENATAESVAALTRKLHQDQPFLLRYWNWLVGALHGNFGDSLNGGQSVSSIISTRLPVTIELVLIAIVLSVIVAIPIALLAAHRPGGWADRITLGVSMIGISVPNFALALVLILVFAVRLRALPALGYVPLGKGELLGNLRTVVLPGLALAFPLFCHYVRVLRADLIDQVNSEDYVMTALAKGVAPGRVLTQHVLRNSMFSLLTIIGLNLGVLIGGTVVIEQIFAVPGVGQALLQGIMLKDIPVVEALVLCLSIAVVVANLLTDMLYAVLDPRIRDGARKS